MNLSNLINPTRYGQRIVAKTMKTLAQTEENPLKNLHFRQLSQASKHVLTRIVQEDKQKFFTLLGRSQLSKLQKLPPQEINNIGIAEESLVEGLTSYTSITNDFSKIKQWIKQDLQHWIDKPHQ
jgi:hypothetical protein